MNKEYLGDGVYVQRRGGSVDFMLTTEDGFEVTNVIYLDGEMIIRLAEYVETAWKVDAANGSEAR